ncbi:hypothetical protein [Flavobacterium sp. 123]|jgi:hypothetical protein|uniref:hypothetical protein n=1 Tax=Flavobacterium sp. 123 TaxID=2135627 RepID=UPI000EAD182B|nr:hypothetical protein [Flavobacterium sp. 123]RKT00673.1 hypothetical protein C8C88_2506 [Flavobacterium sp. 123]
MNYSQKTQLLITLGIALFLMALLSFDLSDLSLEHNTKAYFKITVSTAILIIAILRIRKIKKEKIND